MTERQWQVFALGVTSFAALAVVTVIAFSRKQSTRKPKKPKMKLYWFDNFRSKRCEWLLTGFNGSSELGGLSDVEMICINPRDKDQEKLAKYRSIHPHGTVPTLEIEGQEPVIESGAICLFLADLYEKLVPAKAEDRAAYYNWLVYSVSTLDETMEHLFQQWVLTDLQNQDNELIDRMVRKFQTIARYLSSILENRDYLCGDRFTAADCVLGTSIWRAAGDGMRNGVLLQNYPVLLNYYSRLSRRSAFQRTFPAEFHSLSAH